MRRHRGVAVGVICMGLFAVACGSDTLPVDSPTSSAGTSSTPSTSPAATAPVSQPAVRSSEAPFVTIDQPPPTEPSEDTEPTLAPASTPAPTSAPTTTSGVGDPGLSPFVEVAVADLASRLDVTESEITVMSAQRIVWPDGALGCPQPGMVYTQVQVDGFRIMLAAHGVEFAYHGGGTRGPFLCETPDV